MGFRDSEPMFPMKHPCPCGSGKKFKHCCVDEVYVDASAVLRRERASPGYLTTLVEALETDPMLPKGT